MGIHNSIGWIESIKQHDIKSLFPVLRPLSQIRRRHWNDRGEHSDIIIQPRGSISSNMPLKIPWPSISRIPLNRGAIDRVPVLCEGAIVVTAQDFIQTLFLFSQTGA